VRQRKQRIQWILSQGPFAQAIFVAATRRTFCRAQGCNFKSARVNQVRCLVRFVAAISHGFRTCLKLDAILARQKLHRVNATKITCVNWPSVIPREKGGRFHGVTFSSCLWRNTLRWKLSQCSLVKCNAFW